MLSYRHGFHAGNFADVHKHAVLTMIIQALLGKDKAFCCLDTHSGSGMYALKSAYAQKACEYADGIARLWDARKIPAALKPYMNAVRAANAGNELRNYPGSPWLARHMLRPDDRLVLCELHPSDYPLLKQLFDGVPQTAVHHQDGYQWFKAFLPPKERRGLVLIDPAYEQRDEFRVAATALMQAWQRWDTGIYSLWYPMVGHKPLKPFYDQLRDSGMRKVLVSEFRVKEKTDDRSMYGSGMIVVNPPWKLEEQLREVMPWLWERLSREGQGGVRCEWLVPE